MFVGIGQGGTRRRPAYVQMLQFALAGGQTVADLAQRFGITQLTKHHRYKLRPTVEAAGVALGLGLVDRSQELPAIHQLDHLSENAAYFIHAGRLLIFCFGPRSPTQNSSPSGAPRCGDTIIRPRANLDNSEISMGHQQPPTQASVFAARLPPAPA